MAINVNTVYTTVLSILNKEQRGYVTPYEFNNVANQVQLELYEKYFEDLNQELRKPSTEENFVDKAFDTEIRLDPFHVDRTVSKEASGFKWPTDLYKLNLLKAKNPNHRNNTGFDQEYVMIEKVANSDLIRLRNSNLTKPDYTNPVWVENNYNGGTYAQVYPGVVPNIPITNPAVYDIVFDYYKTPNVARWGYIIGSLGQYVYDPNVYVATGLPVVSNLLFNSLTSNFGSAGASINTVQWNNLTSSSTGVTYVGSGTGAKFNLTMTTLGVITNLTVIEPGSGYADGDTFTFNKNIFQSPTPGVADAVVTLNSSSLYSGTIHGSTNFELSNNDQTRTILEILKYSGLIINDSTIIQSAAGEIAMDDQNQKL
jgi:hypothetical protein